MKRKGPITMAAVLLLGGAVIPALPGVSIRSAAAADEPRDSAHVSAGTGLVRAVALLASEKQIGRAHV